MKETTQKMKVKKKTLREHKKEKENIKKGMKNEI